MLSRQSIVVYFKNPKILKQLKRVGNVMYFHKKRKYAIIYVNSDQVDTVLEELRKFRQVRKVDVSKLDFSMYDIDFNVK